MKIFDKSESWSTKKNFVDENNVVVGFDMDQSCCETADWYISDEKMPSAAGIRTPTQSLDNESDWRFDPEFFEETSDVVLENERDYNPLDSGAVATFRLVNSEGAEKFLHLFNCHNGYYSHGFTMKAGDTELHSGSL